MAQRHVSGTPKHLKPYYLHCLMRPEISEKPHDVWSDLPYPEPPLSTRSQEADGVKINV